MNRILFGSVLIFSITLRCMGASDATAGIRIAVSNVVVSLPDGRRSLPEYIREFGYRYDTNSRFREMAVVVSNDFDVAFSNLDVCAPNSISRLVLLSSAWAYDENYYFRSLTNALELVSRNVITVDEFKWLRSMSGKMNFLCYLANEYTNPAVSNFVMRMKMHTGETNYCNRILSGESKLDVQKVTDAMSAPDS